MYSIQCVIYKYYPNVYVHARMREPPSSAATAGLSMYHPTARLLLSSTKFHALSRFSRQIVASAQSQIVSNSSKYTDSNGSSSTSSNRIANAISDSNNEILMM